MSDSITCICGYRGPSVPEAGRPVCPICRTPAETSWLRPAPAAPVAAPVAPAAPAVRASPAATRPSGPKYYRLACPNGHKLKVGTAMIGQQAVCPTCNVVFELRLEDSREYQREQEVLRQRKEAEDAEKWLKRAIWAAVFIVASLIGMTVLYAVFRRGSRRESPPPPPQEIVAPADEATEAAAPADRPAEPVAEPVVEQPQ